MKISKGLKAKIATIAFQVAMGLMNDSEAIAQALESIAAALRGGSNASNP